jgi:hypothetical protein
MVEDPALRSLTGDAVFAPDKLRLFRAHNAELLTLCLSRVLEQAWRSNIVERGASRSFFAAEADFRVQLAWQAERPAAIADHLAATETFEAEPVVIPALRPAPLRFAAAACLLLGLLFWATHARAAETLPPFKLDGRAYTNAVVIEANPVDVLIRQEELGFKRLKRQQMPAELKDRFPYDAKEVEEYEKQQTAKAKARREQTRAEAYAALVRQETELQARIDRLDAEMAAMQKEIKLWRAKPNHPPKKIVLVQLLDKKLGLMRHSDELRKQLEGVRKLQAQYR